MATRFLGPVQNREKGDGSRQWFSNLPMGYGPEVVEYYNDFLSAQDYNTTNFTLTLVGTGTAAVNTTSNNNGLLLLTTTNTSADSNSLQGKQESFKIQSGKRLWFETKLQASRVTDADILIALAKTDTTPLDDSDYVGFKVTNGAATVDAKTVASSSATTTSAVATLVAATDMTLGFYWDGISRVYFFANRGLVATHTATIPSAGLALTAHIKTNSANASVLTIDYLYAAQER
jgi:hypothetical protein